MDAIYHWIGLLIFWALIGLGAFVATLLFWSLVQPIYRRTWLFDGIDAFRVWWAFDLKKEPLAPEQVEFLKRVLEKRKRYNPFKWWLLRFVDRHTKSRA